MATDELKKIKSSLFQRTMSLTQMTLKIGGSVANHTLQNVFSHPSVKESKWASLLLSQSKMISEELGQLKGSLMKAGQMLSMYGEHFLPPEANEFLKSLQSDSHTLVWSEIEKQLKKYLSPELLQELEIEKTALASASMGQVHRAVIKATGEQIVLKIQYPDVEKAIENDLRSIKLILSVLNLLPKDLNVTPLFAEIKELLLQETDYRQEALLTVEYAERLKHDTRFIVPKIYQRYCADKIIASSYEEGVRIDSTEVASLSLDRRNKIAENFLDLYFLEIFNWSTVQTDPHFGNYKIRLNESGLDQIILLDFGATKIYDKTFMTDYKTMMMGALDGDAELFYRSAIDLGFLFKEDSLELKKFFHEFCRETMEPFMVESYDWGQTDLPDRLSKKGFEIAKRFSWRSPPPQFLFLNRKTAGVFIVLTVLKSKFNARSILLRHFA